MSRVRELEQRLRDEPGNLGLRVQLAGALRTEGRQAEAVELYRSVAIAYRDQGRAQQAIAVCRSILEIAPGDAGCQTLLAALAPPPRRSSLDDRGQPIERGAGAPRHLGPRESLRDETPLPGALPYHVADPTTRNLPKLDVEAVITPDPEDRETEPGVSLRRPTSENDVSGLASAARRIAASLVAANAVHDDDVDISIELDTRQRPRIDEGDLAKISQPPPTVPVERVELDEDATTPVVREVDTEDEDTKPRETD